MDFIFEIIKERCETQLRGVDAIDTKAGVTIGAVAVIAALLSLGDETVAGFQLWQVIILVALLAASLVTGLAAYMPRRWRVDPEPRPFYRKYAGQAVHRVKQQLIANYIEGFESNWRTYVRKVRMLAWSIRLLGVAGGSLLVMFVWAYVKG